ncbi:uncharacterized protein EV154DRAFT_420959, partial [Mucor mucedo]|uniref:uncharacterized protein n=1 Tax=Mucor mucedo TaxID=29922 RepID=UPI00221FE00F
ISTIFLYEDRHGNVIDEEDGPESINYIVVETFATRREYMNTVFSSGSSLTSPMLIEKPKDEDTCVDEVNVKRNYVCYTVQDKARLFFS